MVASRPLRVIVSAILIVACLGTTANAAWTLKFTARDIIGGYTNQYKDFGDLDVLVDGKVVERYDTLSGDHNYGGQEIDLTKHVKEGSRLSLKLHGRREALLLYDIDVLHDGRPVRFSPWTLEKSQEEVRGYSHSDDWLIMVLGADLPPKYDNYAIYTTQPLTDAPELEVKQSDLSFSKPIYTIKDGDEIEAYVTVRNIGGRKEQAAKLRLLADGELLGESGLFSLETGQSTTKTFNINVDYGGKKFVKIEAQVVPEDDMLEGKESNNRAVKYLLRRPSMFFSDIRDTPVRKYWGQEPYSGWVNSLNYGLGKCLNHDYSSESMSEAVRADCAARLALHHQLYGSNEHAEKARQALTHIGDGQWTWADRSKDGNAAKGSLNKGENENYGVGNVAGAFSGKILFLNALAYDWVHNYAVEYDQKHGKKSTREIRDRIARLVTDNYLFLKEIYSYGDHGTGVSGFAFGDYGTGRLALEGPFGVAAMSILDYDGRYQDLDGSPHEWVTFVEKDLAVESMAGARLSNLDQHMSREGLYEEGSGYRDYYEPSLSYFIGLYNDVLGVNMAEKYPIVDGTMKDVPLTMSPPGRYPNMVVSHASVWHSVVNSLLVYDIGSGERDLINHYINYSILHPRGYRGEAGDYGTYFGMLVYDKSESHKPPTEPSYFSPGGTINVLRSGWGRDALYSFMKAPNEPTMSGHAPMELHQLSYDFWAKGAYLIIDGGDERFLPQYYSGDILYGHTTWLFDEDGEERWVARQMKGQYGETSHNPAYVSSSLTGEALDHVRGEMSVTTWYHYPKSGQVKNPFHVVRDMILVGDEYLIVADTLTSEEDNSYSMILPYGSANGHTGKAKDPSDNWALGELSFNGRKQPWFDYEKNQALESETRDVGTIVWDSVTETNSVDTVAKPVSLSTHLNPKADVKVKVSGMHYGNYGQEFEWAFPYALVSQDGSNVKYLTVHYPTADGDEKPLVANLPVSGGDGNDYATKVSRTGAEDLVMVSDNEVVTADEVTTNAELALLREEYGILAFYFIADGTGLDYEGAPMYRSSGQTNALVEYGEESVTAKIQAGGPVTLYLKTNLAAGKGIRVLFDGARAGHSYDGKTVSVKVPGSGIILVQEAEGEYEFADDVAVPKMEAGKKGPLLTTTTNTLPGATSTSQPLRYTLPQPTRWLVIGPIMAFMFALICFTAYIYWRKRSK